MTEKNKFKLTKNFAFTLAEILIALAIVGIVSALTVPTLMNKYKDKVQAVATHKFVTQFEDATGSYLAEKRADNIYEAGFDNDGGIKFIKDVFKIVTDCGETAAPCFAPSYTSIDGNSTTNGIEKWCNNSYTISSGVAICTGNFPYGTYMYNEKKHYYGYFYFDINGPKPPNIAGKDFFLAYIFEDGSLDSPEVATPECKKFNNATACGGFESLKMARTSVACTNNSWPAGCLGRLRDKDWEMDY